MQVAMAQQDKANVPVNNSELLHVKKWFGGSDGSKNIHKPIGNGNPVIARGAFGEISIAIGTGDDRWRLLAVKTIAQCTTTINAGGWGSSLSDSAPAKAKLSREVFHEICALRLVNPHPNIVQLLAVYPSKDSPMGGGALSLVFPYCPIDLYVAQEWRRRSLMPLLPFHVIQAIAYDMFSALRHCHTRGVIHCDIKPGNLLVSSTGHVKLCDFGLARPYQTVKDDSKGKEDARGLCTLYYRPPELLLGGAAESPAVDNYSAGLVLAELVTGFPLFRGGNVLGQLAAIFELLGSPDDEKWPAAVHLPDHGKLQFTAKAAQPLASQVPRATESPGLLQLLENLIVLDPPGRYSAEQVLGNDWLKATTDWIDRWPLLQELIPSSLREQVILSQPDMELSVASKQALSVSAANRNVLSSSFPTTSLPSTLPRSNDEGNMARTHIRKICK